ncbi:hypothetical protein H0H87_003175 [Tephrocybe sp. NHM501043]|nr:hypothetical protein H0H87_003175 [Tephrocybe sp. NHM501043]
MLAVSATGTLSILNVADLKRAPLLSSPCLSLTSVAISSTWSFDNSALFLTSAQIIHRYDPVSNILKNIHVSTSAEGISHIVCKDKGTVIYSAGDKVHLLECGTNAKITQTFQSHKSLITSLSLSNDYTFLASTSSNAVHIHNLAIGSHTVLRGLVPFGPNITTSTFHPHGRTRLLLGIGKQLVVYDITRPSGPVKSVALNETSSGDIVAVACSPFSKTLVAVATSGGNVGLIDLEKEKGLFRTLNLKVPLTTLAFSPEGAALYLGTEHGKLLILDLRALDKAPKAITVSEVGCRIETMSVQRKLKSGEASARSTPTAASTSRPAASGKATVPSPAPAPATRASSAASPARRLPSATSRESVVSNKATPRKPSEKKVFSPVRDPLGNSVGDISIQIEALKGVNAKPKPIKPERRPSSSPLRSRLVSSPKAPSLSAISSRTTTRESEPQEELPRRSRTVPAATRAKKPSKTLESSTLPSNTHLAVPTSDLLQPGERVSSRPRAGSSSSHVASISTAAVATSISVRSNRPSSRLRHTSPRTTSRTDPLPTSRTPSPDLPDINHDPITPIPTAKKSGGFGVLGMGSPEVDRWLHAGRGEDRAGTDRKGKGKTVGFKGDSDDGGEDSDHDESDRERERERSLSMQVSPRRPSMSWQASPVYKSPSNISGGGGGSSAHDLLRTIVKDVMYDFQRDTRSEMTGLHLDLVRMGRGWKRELREIMQEYAGGMEELREENRRLREENERLRRGY